MLLPVFLVFGIAIWGAGIADAQQVSPEDLAARQEKTRQELAILQNDITLSESRKQELNAEIASLEEDRVGINRGLIDTATRSRAIEERIDRNANRLEELQRRGSRRARIPSRKARPFD